MNNEIVDVIFKKMTLRWGRKFLGIWEGVDLLDVKGDWAHELRNMPPENIAHGLLNLPDDPCTVGQFKRICNAMPPPVFKALPAPAVDSAKVAAMLAKAKEALKVKA
jgi:hypothetical protein